MSQGFRQITEPEKAEEIAEELPKMSGGEAQCPFTTEYRDGIGRNSGQYLNRSYRCGRAKGHGGACVEYKGETPTASWFGLDMVGGGHGVDERIRAEKGNRREDFDHLRRNNWRGPGQLLRD